MTIAIDGSSSTLESLEAKYRSIEAALPTNFRTRARRVLSWLERAQQETGDPYASFIFHWIAFHASYADRHHRILPRRVEFKTYFSKVVALDTRNTLRDRVLDDLTETILDLVANPYAFEPFWDYCNGLANSSDDWQNLLIDGVESVRVHLENGDIADALTTLFLRIYSLRRQIFHGDATWNHHVNRSQVEDAVEVIASLLPILIDLMMDGPHMFDGPSRYPVVERETAQMVDEVRDHLKVARSRAG